MDDDKKKERSSLGKDMDSIMGGMSLSELSVINGRTLTDDDHDPEREVNRLDLEVEWTREEKVPIHELVIRSKKKESKK